MKNHWWLLELISETTGNSTAYYSADAEWTPILEGADLAKKFRWKWTAQFYIWWHFGRWAYTIVKPREHLWLD